MWHTRTQLESQIVWFASLCVLTHQWPCIEGGWASLPASHIHHWRFHSRKALVLTSALSEKTQTAATAHPRLYFCVTPCFIKHCFPQGLCQAPQPTHNSIHRGLWLEMRHSSGFQAVWCGATDTRERGGDTKGEVSQYLALFFSCLTRVEEFSERNGVVLGMRPFFSWSHLLTSTCTETPMRFFEDTQTGEELSLHSPSPSLPLPFISELRGPEAAGYEGRSSLPLPAMKSLKFSYRWFPKQVSVLPTSSQMMAERHHY